MCQGRKSVVLKRTSAALLVTCVRWIGKGSLGTESLLLQQRLRAHYQCGNGQVQHGRAGGEEFREKSSRLGAKAGRSTREHQWLRCWRRAKSRSERERSPGACWGFQRPAKALGTSSHRLDSPPGFSGWRPQLQALAGTLLEPVALPHDSRRRNSAASLACRSTLRSPLREGLPGLCGRGDPCTSHQGSNYARTQSSRRNEGNKAPGRYRHTARRRQRQRSRRLSQNGVGLFRKGCITARRTLTRLPVRVLTSAKLNTAGQRSKVSLRSRPRLGLSVCLPGGTERRSLGREDIRQCSSASPEMPSSPIF